MRYTTIVKRNDSTYYEVYNELLTVALAEAVALSIEHEAAGVYYTTDADKDDALPIVAYKDGREPYAISQKVIKV